MTVNQALVATLPSTWTDRYLTLLGVERSAPSPDALAALTRAHLESVLFGTVQAILRRQANPTGPIPPLDLAEILDAWEHRTGSGVCFEIAGMVHQLLTSLGYRAHVVLGTIGLPGAHQAVVVDLEQRRYLVDVGNGAPFFDPIPLDGLAELWHVGLGYRFHPGGDEQSWHQDRWIGGSWQSFCTYDLRPAADSDREIAYQRHHVYEASWVVSSLRLIHCGPSEVAVLDDGSVKRFTDAGKAEMPLDEPSDYARLAAELFRAPDLPLDRARAWLAAHQPNR